MSVATLRHLRQVNSDPRLGAYSTRGPGYPRQPTPTPAQVITKKVDTQFVRAGSKGITRPEVEIWAGAPKRENIKKGTIPEDEDWYLRFNNRLRVKADVEPICDPNPLLKKRQSRTLQDTGRSCSTGALGFEAKKWNPGTYSQVLGRPPGPGIPQPALRGEGARETYEAILKREEDKRKLLEETPPIGSQVSASAPIVGSVVSAVAPSSLSAMTPPPSTLEVAGRASQLSACAPISVLSAVAPSDLSEASNFFSWRPRMIS
eukprot:TRINITY_DN19804_c0_g2_i1.p1 TRINITY_DN19804_c0_g2~~TRINITY_DN19804_c0_g2_i1.p1  ORF type:complete len:261 (-),score=45.64 TRINITY_DN19804_c0_g2_i1:66-848(-)